MNAVTLAVMFTGLLAYGQDVDKSPTFEVASIKPATPPTPDGRGRIMLQGPSGGPGSKDPGRIHYPFMSLKNLLMNAYDVKNFQIVGPPWLDSERFDITATMPPETTKEQFRVMLQNLLAERFKLAVHHETKELPMYALTVAKSGPKLQEAKETPPPADGDVLPPPPPGGPKMGADGFPELPPGILGRPGMFNIMMPGRARFVARQQTMQDLAQRLTGQLNRPVADETGLTGKYDFTLTFQPTEGMMGPMGALPVAPPPPGGAAGGAPASMAPEGAELPPDIFRAVQSQLGLRLDAKKGSVDVIVIDHMEKAPTEN
ncbi:MAG TPA: TIGR03435 family protein [Candidatus Sulfopaludibacter sp.]|nr:TIGR03435 family protein [Candidatus Sulfopaludibacter sp.]